MDGLDPDTRKEIMDEQNGDADYQQPHPLIGEDDDVTKPSFEPTPTRESNINYVCPNCTGGFSSFDNSLSDTGTKRCPFCHVEVGEFGDSKNTDELIEENETLRDELAEAYEQIDQLQDALEEVESKLQ